MPEKVKFIDLKLEVGDVRDIINALKEQERRYRDIVASGKVGTSYCSKYDIMFYEDLAKRRARQVWLLELELSKSLKEEKKDNDTKTSEARS